MQNLNQSEYYDIEKQLISSEKIYILPVIYMLFLSKKRFKKKRDKYFTLQIFLFYFYNFKLMTSMMDLVYFKTDQGRNIQYFFFTFMTNNEGSGFLLIYV